jgi:hypothetical protein
VIVILIEWISSRLRAQQGQLQRIQKTSFPRVVFAYQNGCVRDWNANVMKVAKISYGDVAKFHTAYVE